MQYFRIFKEILSVLGNIAFIMWGDIHPSFDQDVSMVFQAKIPPLVSDLSTTRGGIFASDQKIPTCAKNTVFFGAPAAHFPLYFAYFRAFRSPFDILYRKCSSMKILSTEIQHEICFANSRRRLYHCKNPVSHDVSGQGGCISLYFCHW